MTTKEIDDTLNEIISALEDGVDECPDFSRK
jgi:hypothetical protein